MISLQSLQAQLKSPRTWVAAAVAFLVAVGFLYYKNSAEFDPGADVRSFTSVEQLEDFYKNLSKAYEKDTYGGKTPDETLQLFVEALKQGDTALAAKYFVPERQRKEAEDLRVGKEKGNLSKLVSILEKDRDGSYVLDGNHYEFNTFDKDGVAEFNFSLIFNPVTKVWKIESL